jgi:hypothetical protein
VLVGIKVGSLISLQKLVREILGSCSVGWMLMPQGGVGDNLKFRHSANEPSSRGLAVPVCDLVFVFLSFGEMEVSLV